MNTLEPLTRPAIFQRAWPIILANASVPVLDGSSEVERLAADYFVIRIWAAPATLGTFALMGLLIGLGRSRALLLVQLVLNGTNIVLDAWFADVLGWGAQGIALGDVRLPPLALPATGSRTSQPNLKKR